MGAHPGREWSDDRIEQLRKLWAEGWPTAEIGRRLGVSKNAAVGKAGRIGLSRPSPIRPKPEGGTVRTTRARLKREKLPELASVVAEVPGCVIVSEVGPRVPAASPPRHQCEWLEGHRAPYVRCENAVKPGASWCKEHYARVFVRTPSRRDGGHDFTFARKTF